MTVIKRYSNRKLYDSEAGRYVTLDELGERIGRGEEINVIDHNTGTDLTAVTLMQVIFEREKKVGGLLPKAILTSLIQTGNLAINSLRDSLVTFRESNQTIEDEIRRRLKILLDDGLVAAEEFQRMTDLMLSSRWHQHDQVEDPNAANPEEVDALLKQVEDLEREIQTLKASQVE